MGYSEIKALLKERCGSIRGFSEKTFDVIIADRAKASELPAIGGDVQGFYKNSVTSKTGFYVHNGGAYCELLSILAE